MPQNITALNDRRKKIPLPAEPRVENYGEGYCGQAHTIQLFPAIVRSKETAMPETMIESDQASCFYHPKLQAEVICEISGRFICNLCKTEWEGQTVSLTALEEMRKQGTEEKLQTKRVLWDDIALALAILPCLIWPITIATAPTALAISLWQWRKGPTSLVRKSRFRYILAILFALPQIVLWALLIFGLITDDYLF